MAEDIETKINKLKREKHCLEFDLTCNGIINYGPIMRRLDEVNAELKKLKEKYEND
jgi:hypothetical protein